VHKSGIDINGVLSDLSRRKEEIAVYRRFPHTTENNRVYAIEISETDCEEL
jgi:hypothetical protein